MRDGRCTSKDYPSIRRNKSELRNADNVVYFEQAGDTLLHVDRPSDGSVRVVTFDKYTRKQLGSFALKSVDQLVHNSKMIAVWPSDSDSLEGYDLHTGEKAMDYRAGAFDETGVTCIPQDAHVVMSERHIFHAYAPVCACMYGWVTRFVHHFRVW